MNGFPIVVLAAGLIAPGASPSEPSVQLVTFDDLQRRFGEPHLRLLDARPQGEYEKGTSRVRSGLMPRLLRRWRPSRGR